MLSLLLIPFVVVVVVSVVGDVNVAVVIAVAVVDGGTGVTWSSREP